MEIFDEIPIKLKKVIKSFYVFDDRKKYNVLFVTLNDKVFGFGFNAFGVCGFGHQMVVNEPKIIEELCDKSVIQFYNGICSAFALTSDNKLYGWSNNQFGQLGVKVINNGKLYKPVLIEDLNDINIKQISCGLTHTLVLSNEGIVYGWGGNYYGQIGCGKESGKNISVITQLKTLKNIKSIHCSLCKSFALTDNGMVYSWGHNKWCNLGHELDRNECVFKPKLIENLTNISSICSTLSNTYFLLSDGIIYFCGYLFENYYQMIPKSFKTIIKPSINSLLSLHSKLSFESLENSLNNRENIATLLIDETIYEIHSNIVKRTNYQSLDEYYLKEYNITYQTIHLNNEIINEIIIESITDKYIENKVSISEDLLKSFFICNNNNINNFSIKYIHIFDDNNGFNALFVTNEDKVFGFGSNQWGVCGLGHNKNVKDPQIIHELSDKNIQQFHNGLSFVLGITSDKELYGWGRNDFGQLAKSLLNDDIHKPNIININYKIINQISCGSQHSLMLTFNGMVYGWGNNYYGQIGCGKESGERISVITQLKTLTKIKAIHCSFSDSFALTDNGIVYSWGYNRRCNLGHESEQNESVFEPKSINLFNIQSISSTFNNTYLLSNEGNIYFCGEYYDKNHENCFQKIPQIILKQSNIISLYSINCYQTLSPISCALSEECVYSFSFNEIHKTNYVNIEEFFTNECQLTYNTYYLRLLSETQKINIKMNGKGILNFKNYYSMTFIISSCRDNINPNLPPGIFHAIISLQLPRFNL